MTFQISGEEPGLVASSSYLLASIARAGRLCGALKATVGTLGFTLSRSGTTGEFWAKDCYCWLTYEKLLFCNWVLRGKDSNSGGGCSNPGERWWWQRPWQWWGPQQWWGQWGGSGFVHPTVYSSQFTHKFSPSQPSPLCWYSKWMNGQTHFKNLFLNMLLPF